MVVFCCVGSERERMLLLKLFGGEEVTTSGGRVVGEGVNGRGRVKSGGEGGERGGGDPTAEEGRGE